MALDGVCHIGKTAKMSQKNFVRKIRNSQNKTLAQLAELSGYSEAYLSRIESGGRNLSANTMKAIAEALQVPVSDLISSTPSFKSIGVVGAVEAGVLRESTEWPESEHYSISIPIPDTYDMAKPFALEVRGPSMNKRYPAGSILICANLYNLNEDPISGKRYIVEKINPDGTRETTVKRIEFDDETEVWLWPESTDPNHQTPEKVNGHDAPEGFEIRILARVLKVIIDED